MSGRRAFSPSETLNNRDTLGLVACLTGGLCEHIEFPCVATYASLYPFDPPFERVYLTLQGLEKEEQEG